MTRLHDPSLRLVPPEVRCAMCGYEDAAAYTHAANTFTGEDAMVCSTGTCVQRFEADAPGGAWPRYRVRYMPDPGVLGVYAIWDRWELRVAGRSHFEVDAEARCAGLNAEHDAQEVDRAAA